MKRAAKPVNDPRGVLTDQHLTLAPPIPQARLKQLARCAEASTIEGAVDVPDDKEARRQVRWFEGGVGPSVGVGGVEVQAVALVLKEQPSL